MSYNIGMTKNPFWNAAFAALYIVGVVSLIQYALTPLEGGEEKTLLIPIMMLSLFVLSAAVMGYIFLGAPVQLYLDGGKKQAAHLFLKTVAAFAGITAILFLSVFLSGLF